MKIRHGDPGTPIDALSLAQGRRRHGGKPFLKFEIAPDGLC
jgi:hypothetical protein